ncbi:uncharacterized protein LOC110641569 [Hevea brasiliensis]|uniref:uncharacterized protein LOC110641569 n=1 Tax=Hevea brasiliensis TaxID=3981 RepID=UPI0025F12E5B|nr:uncharacterized protein LOC110641569 [Hevea brasiliensis]
MVPAHAPENTHDHRRYAPAKALGPQMAGAPQKVGPPQKSCHHPGERAPAPKKSHDNAPEKAPQPSKKFQLLPQIKFLQSIPLSHQRHLLQGNMDVSISVRSDARPILRKSPA